MRKDFVMTGEQYTGILNAGRPTRAMYVSGGIPGPTPRDHVNAAWLKLGMELGFVWDSVRPSGDDLRKFTAEIAEHQPGTVGEIPVA